MKKLLVLMLCAMLAVPGVGMNAHAAETAETAGEPATQSEGEASQAAATASEADDVAEDWGKLLNQYYASLKFTTEKEKEAAAKIMEEAAKQLGLDYDEATGKLNSSTDATEFKTAKKVNEYAKAVKEELAACKAPVQTPSTDTPGSSTPGTGTSTAPVNNSNVIIGGKEYETSTANAGHSCEIAVPLVNLGETDVTNVVITPVLSSDPTVWPFDIEKTDYSQVCDELEGEDSGKEILKRKHTFRWALRTRDDAVTGYTKLSFNVSYNEADGTKGSVTLDYYVQVNGVEPTEENGKISTPRVIVTGFTTTPEEVYAGDTFKLTLNLKNTSKTTAVSNMLFDIQGTQEGTDANNTYAAFLPTAGSSTVFVDSIGPNGTKSISIEMKSKADLAQKPYVVTVNMEYEDSNANPFSETASVSVPIKQEAKVDISSISLMPESIEVGNDANAMFSIYNVGKTKLYNVNVKFEAESVSGGDTFLGNLEPGATGNIDAYLTGQMATADDGTVKILITYEDEEGKQSVIEKTMTLYVNEPYYEEFDDSMMGDPMEMEEQKGMPWWGIAMIVIVIAAGAVTAFLVIRKKKKAKKLAQEEMELIEALEDSDSEE